MTDSSKSQFPDEPLPNAIVCELRQSDRVPFGIPPDRTTEILWDAREYLASRPVVRPVRRWLRITAAVSSVCAALLVFTVTQIADNDQHTAPPEVSVMEMHQPTLNPRDVDENGTVDILDAYVMARLLKSGEPEKRWDFNSDGQMNEDDVELVAFDAVML